MCCLSFIFPQLLTTFSTLLCSLVSTLHYTLSTLHYTAQLYTLSTLHSTILLLPLVSGLSLLPTPDSLYSISKNGEVKNQQGNQAGTNF